MMNNSNSNPIISNEKLINFIHQNFFDLLIISFISLCYIYTTLKYSYSWMDDSYISYRYSEHLAHGLGLDWNFGTDEVNNQGYTNFLWVLIIGIFIQYFDPLLISRIISIFSGICIIIITNQIIKYFNQDDNIKKYSSIFVFPLGFFPIFSICSNFGLETIFFSFLIELALFIHLISKSNQDILSFQTNKKQYLSVVLFICAALTRPEGIIFTLGIYGFEFINWILYSKRLDDFKCILKKFSIFIVIMGIYFVFCYMYYHQILPNSFYVKYIQTSIFNQAKLKNYNLDFYKEYYWLIFGLIFDIIIMICAFIQFQKLQNKIRAQHYHIYRFWLKNTYIIIILQQILINYLIVPLQGSAYRFFVPIIPLLIISFASSIIFIPRIMIRIFKNIIRKFNFIIDENSFSFYVFNKIYHRELVDILLLLIIVIPNLIQYDMKYYIYDDNNNRTLYAIGEWLNDNFPNDTKIALTDAGVIPYYSKMWTLDLYSINSKELIFDYPNKLDWIFTQNISIFILTSTYFNNYSYYNYSDGYSTLVFNSPYFQSNYHLCMKIILYDEKIYGGMGYYYFVFISNLFYYSDSIFQGLSNDSFYAIQ